MLLMDESKEYSFSRNHQQHRYPSRTQCDIMTHHDSHPQPSHHKQQLLSINQCSSSSSPSPSILSQATSQIISNNQSRALQRIRHLVNHLQPSSNNHHSHRSNIDNNNHFSVASISQSSSGNAAAEDELDILVRRAEDLRIQEELSAAGQVKRQSGQVYERVKYMPYLIVPTFVEESTRAGEQSRARRRKRVKILYDVHSARAQTPAFLDVSQDDPKTPLAFRYIRIILLTAEARRAQDIHLDQHSASSMSVVFTTQLGVTGRIMVRGAVVQSIIYYIAFYDLLTAGKSMPGPVRDYALQIKVKTHAFLQGTHNVYRVNCIRTNHELGYYHIVMRVLQN